MSPTVPINAAFLDRLRQRDPAALAEAVRDHARPLFAGALAMGFSKEQSEDLVHDVFAAFFERLDKFEGRSQLRTWLFGILYRKAQELRRSNAKDERADPIDESFASRFDAHGSWSQPPTADLERLLLSKEIGQFIRGCLNHLPFNQRQVFLLREVEDFDTDQICKILDVSATHFGVLLFRARTRLRECLEAKGLGRSS